MLDIAWEPGDKLNQDARRALWAEMEILSDPLNLTQIILPQGSRQQNMTRYFLFKAYPKTVGLFIWCKGNQNADNR